MAGKLSDHHDHGATKIIDRIPKSGMEKQLETAIQNIITEMRQYPGYSAVHVIKPAAPEQPAYRVICTFDSEAQLQTWDSSAAHLRLIEEADQFTAGEPQRTWLTGLETWFTLPVSSNVHGRPPAYKMAATTFAALFPTILAVHALLSLIPVFNEIPTVVGSAISVAIVVTLMTYVIMPRFTRLISFWLYPKKNIVR